MLTLVEAAKWLIDRDNFLILSHKSPDGDTIGSSAGLCIALREQGKTAYMLKNDEIPDDFLPFVENLQSADFEPDFVVSVDIATEELFTENAKKYKGKVDLSIDHHPPRDIYGKENCILDEKAACGELIFGIVTQWGSVSKAVAAPLYVALSTDTGCFVYGNTTAESHLVASELIKTGLEIRPINKKLFQTVTLIRLKLESKLLENMKLFDQGKVAIVCVTQSMLAEINATDDDVDDIASFVAKIEGVVTGITIREKNSSLCKISMRSDPDVLKANDVCSKLGGGGHAAASGAKFNGSVEETITTLMTAIEDVRGTPLIPVET